VAAPRVQAPRLPMPPGRPAEPLLALFPSDSFSFDRSLREILCKRASNKKKKKRSRSFLESRTLSSPPPYGPTPRGRAERLAGSGGVRRLAGRGPGACASRTVRSRAALRQLLRAGFCCEPGFSLFSGPRGKTLRSRKA